MSDRPPTRGYLLVDGFSIMAFVAATEPLRIANRIAGRACYVWQILSVSGQSVTASNGMRVLPNAGIDSVSRLSWLAVCSGFLDGRGADAGLVRWLRRLEGGGATPGGI